MAPSEDSISVSITCGNGVSAGITRKDHLVFENDLCRLDFGPGTKTKIKNICEYLNRLSVHLPD